MTNISQNHSINWEILVQRFIGTKVALGPIYGFDFIFFYKATHVQTYIRREIIDSIDINSIIYNFLFWIFIRNSVSFYLYYTFIYYLGIIFQ